MAGPGGASQGRLGGLAPTHTHTTTVRSSLCTSRAPGVAALITSPRAQSGTAPCVWGCRTIEAALRVWITPTQRVGLGEGTRRGKGRPLYLSAFSNGKRTTAASRPPFEWPRLRPYPMRFIPQFACWAPCDRPLSSALSSGCALAASNSLGTSDDGCSAPALAASGTLTRTPHPRAGHAEIEWAAVTSFGGGSCVTQRRRWPRGCGAGSQRPLSTI